jgi:NADH-quinone oxidoreductase subunit G
VLGRRLPYDSLAALRRALFKAHPHLQRMELSFAGADAEIAALAARGGTPESTPFASAVEDFYFTNAVTRSSAIMAECSVIAEGRGALRAAE